MADFPTNGDDVIFGTSGGETIEALGGNDTVFGLGGNDFLWGNSGNDLLNGGLGQNNLIGGDGFDTAYYALMTTGVRANLTTGYAFIDVGGGGENYDFLVGIENLEGGAGDDILTGNRGQNFIVGNNGDDLIKGGSGSDALTGGAGDDKLYGATEADIIDGGSGDDSVWGGSGADLLNGGSDGEFGDTLRYDDSPVGVVIDLAANFASGGDAAGDKISGFENINGSDFGDDLLGNSKANFFWAGNEGDEIEGRGGDDDLYGWGGADNIRGGGGADYINGGLDADVLNGGAGNDNFVYRTAEDSGLATGDRDVIEDFDQGDDHIGLFELPDFDGVFIGTEAFADGVAGQVRYSIGNDKTIIAIDIDGANGADMRIELIGEFALTAGDFIM